MRRKPRLFDNIDRKALWEKAYAIVRKARITTCIDPERPRAADGRALTTSGDYCNPAMGPGRYQDALRRQRVRLPTLPLVAEDCTDIGNKHTECSWGMCSQDPELWPSPDDHIWPESFLQDGRSAPRYGRDLCPLDSRYVVESGRMVVAKKTDNGCFYTCRVFQKHLRTPGREEAQQLYDAAITMLERAQGRLSTDDDGEAQWAADYGATQTLYAEFLTNAKEELRKQHAEQEAAKGSVETPNH